ncbi:syntaxin-binding protein 5-like isoform X3 [Symsagittifera roscoffensis]|uniref:syntaxin-binding protein 5-like isoform X3 n=1 Tax=Symsagittifera roscoffensis TaxID=84072 RepID=UPI00307C70E1
MKKFKQKVFDGFSTSQASSGGSSVNKNEIEIPEVLGSANFELKKTVRHGFPHLPSCLAFDPVQSILAIGTKTGSIKLYGKPGVDGYVSHDSEVAVTKLQFVVNQGGLISVLEDSSVHLWNLKLKSPAIIHSLKFNRERITSIKLPLRSKYLYVGTERANILVVNVDSFTISGYQIQWNRAIGAQRNTHPGPVIEMNECPDDENKLLIGYESGLATLWDLKAKEADQRFFCESNLKSCSWHPDGKSFTCALQDGSLATWNIKNSSKPSQIFAPHALPSQGSSNMCLPICKVDCRCSKSSEAMFLFTGGLPFNASKHTPSLTVMKGKSVTVLEMDHYILDFVTICDSPYLSESQEPQAVMCLLKNDLIILDLVSEGYPPFENPYPMDIHESPVTCLKYLADCPSDLVPALYQVSFKQKQRSVTCSKLPWPVSGGDWKPLHSAYPEVVITGHLDGSVKFWDATAMSFQFLCKVKTARVFERSRVVDSSGTGVGGATGGGGGGVVGGSTEEEPFAIQLLDFDVKQKMLATAGNCAQVLLFNFAKEDTTKEITTIDVSFDSGPASGKDYQQATFHASSTEEAPVSQPTSPHPNSAPVSHQNSVEASPTEKHPHNLSRSMNRNCSTGKLIVKSGSVKVAAGFQIDICCQVLTPLEDTASSPPFTALAVNSFLNLLCFANGFGFSVVDTLNKLVLMSCMTSDLYGTIQESPPPTGANTSGGASSLKGGLAGRKSPKFRSGPKAQDSFAESCAGSDDGIVNPVGIEQRTNHFVSDKTDGGSSGGQSGFSRSRSSSMSSLERADCSDAVQYIAFMHSFPLKNDPSAVLSIWLGTSMSSVACVALRQYQCQSPPAVAGVTSGQPPQGQSQQSQSSTRKMLYSPSNLGLVCSVKGALISICFLDSTGQILKQPDETNTDRKTGTLLVTRSGSYSNGAQSQGANEESTSDRQFLVLTSDKEAKVVSLPSQNVVFRQKLTETSYIVRADPIILSGGACLACYVANGHIIVWSLPSLRVLLDAEYIPLTDIRSILSLGSSLFHSTSNSAAPQSSGGGGNGGLPLNHTPSVLGGGCGSLAGGPAASAAASDFEYHLCDMTPDACTTKIARTFCFSDGGQAFYLCSPFELQRLTISSELCRKLQESVGLFHVQQEMPEQPSRGLFKSLFSSAAAVDREELFGESSGKASKGLAKFQPGKASTNLEGQKNAAGTAAGEAARARMALVERGEKLNQVEDATAQMRDNAQQFSRNAEGLADKYKNKKWYQI